jgi:hypothetical protein
MKRKEACDETVDQPQRKKALCVNVLMQGIWKLILEFGIYSPKDLIVILVCKELNEILTHVDSEYWFWYLFAYRNPPKKDIIVGKPQRLASCTFIRTKRDKELCTTHCEGSIKVLLELGDSNDNAFVESCLVLMKYYTHGKQN